MKGGKYECRGKSGRGLLMCARASKKRRNKKDSIKGEKLFETDKKKINLGDI